MWKVVAQVRYRIGIQQKSASVAVDSDTLLGQWAVAERAARGIGMVVS